ncbi:MAG: hypothetical protein IJL47_00560 [Lachnospiraceae bacterium]|nr:hypothetical protein [Lachnospiraceae bacterium]
MFSVELKKVWMNRLTWAAVLASTALAVLAFVIAVFFEQHNAIGVLPEHVTLLYESGIGQMMLFLLLPVLASFPGACSWYEEKRNNAVCLTLARISRSKYYISKAAATFVSGFAVGIYPFILNYLLCLAAVPRQGILSVSPAMYSGVYTDYFQNFVPGILSEMLFPSLYLNAPGLNMLLHFLLIGLFCGAMALLTYAVSLYYHPNAVVVAILPSLATAVLYLILGALRKSEWIAIDLLQLRSENVNPSAFFVIGVTLLLPFLLSLWLLLMKLKNRDEL